MWGYVSFATHQSFMWRIFADFSNANWYILKKYTLIQKTEFWCRQYKDRHQAMRTKAHRSDIF
jgi:hypothetical protein